MPFIYTSLPFIKRVKFLCENVKRYLLLDLQWLFNKYPARIWLYNSFTNIISIFDYYDKKMAVDISYLLK